MVVFCMYFLYMIKGIFMENVCFFNSMSVQEGLSHVTIVLFPLLYGDKKKVVHLKA